MKNPSSQGASLSHRYLQYLLALGLAMMVAGCKKDKEAPAVIEEVPSTATAETDTSATLSEEPNLQQVGKDKPGSAKNTFHPSGTPSASADKAGFSDAGHYVVQVAVFKSKHQAAGLVEKLANSGYPAYVAEVENPVPALAGTYHRVRIGKFLHITDAKSFGENTLKPMGYEFWVDNKKNDAVGGDGSGYTPAPEPVSRKTKAPAAEPAAPSEPATPSGETWGTPKTEEPAAPAGETWGTPKEPPATTPSAASTPPAPSEPASTAPAKSGPADTGKVNLDEW
ncbi:MAG: Sporulation domain protein [Fibrobacteres bacterium]|nr:Sporulation domain protein [Fibrobacterota bacterium]